MIFSQQLLSVEFEVLKTFASDSRNKMQVVLLPPSVSYTISNLLILYMVMESH